MKPDLPVADPWFDIAEIEPGIHRIFEPHCHRLVRANAFLVKGAERDMLVDTGMGVADLQAALRPLLDKPLIVVATHAHIDHVGGHADFAGVDLLVHELEAQALARPQAVEGLGFDLFSPEQRADLAVAGFDVSGLLVDAVPRAGHDPASYRLRGVTPTRIVGEGDRIDLGNRMFEVLHLPGHSPGGLGLWEASSGTLFAGDTIYDGILIDNLPGGNVADYIASMRRLRDLPVRIVHGGHRESFGRERMVEIIDGYLASRGVHTKLH